jgi:hypothetical protein
VGVFNTTLHPRGPNGRFTRSFARHMNSLDAAKATKAKTGFRSRALRSAADARTYLSGLRGRKGGGIRRHIDSGALGRANQTLRAGKTGPEISAIDAEMKPLPDGLDLYRSVPASKFGHVDPKSLDGMLVSDAGYFPTTVAPTKGGPGTVQLHVQAPAGTKAAVDPDSGQVVLGHGAHLAVDGVDTTPDGSTRMNLVVLPGEGEHPPVGAGNHPSTTPPAPSVPSAHAGPATTTPVGSLIDGDGMPSMLHSDAGAQAARARAAAQLGESMNGTFGPFSTEVVSARRFGGGPDGDNSGVIARLRITDADGNEVGYAERAIYRDDNGDLVAVHEAFELDEGQRGGGLASAFNAHLTEWYRQQGVTRIELTANIDVGGYAWASAGYDFQDEHSANSVLDRLRGAVADLHGPEADAGRALLARAESSPFGSADYPTPFEISQLGRPEGPAGQGRGATWLGKTVMLGSAWEGVRRL